MLISTVIVRKAEYFPVLFLFKSAFLLQENIKELTQLNILFKLKKRQYFSYYCSGKVFKGTVANQEMTLQITVTVPWKTHLQYICCDKVFRTLQEMMTYSLLPNVFNEIADPAISFQFRTIPRNTRKVVCNSAQLRAMEFRLETLLLPVPFVWYVCLCLSLGRRR